MPNSFSSITFTISAKPEESFIFGRSAAVNCFLPIPFKKKNKFVLENQNELPYGQYFHIDFDLAKNNEFNFKQEYLNASWTRKQTCSSWGNDIQVNTLEINTSINNNGKSNFVILQTKGKGHHVGCNLSVTQSQGGWWGEGDDVISIDDDTCPPSIHGTGSEDYFCHAWGMQDNYSPSQGSIIHESKVPGYQVSYRFHISSPIHFKKNIKVTMEHGHANHLSDDWSCTAYWYQENLQQNDFILPADKRLPMLKEFHPKINIKNPTKDQKITINNYKKRMMNFKNKRKNV